ncbi:MAG: hypothetical protein NC241_03620 [Bacteroides sp.]|nr:hypothetical protein [Bacteroides sp.]MCM1457921.1 hypothetical protein [Lachnoclostridium sp.]
MIDFDEFLMPDDAMQGAMELHDGSSCSFEQDFQAGFDNIDPQVFDAGQPGMQHFDDFHEYADSSEFDSSAHMAASMTAAAQISFGAAYSKEEYLEKAENCFKEAKTYYDKAARAEKDFDREHYLREAKKWEARGKEYENKAKYA